ncbi:hypothetical protein D9M68_856010 [compost metagenome]
MSVSTSSCPLRIRLRSPESSRFLASCWVMVEPPMILGGLTALSAASATSGFLARRRSSCSMRFSASCWRRSFLAQADSMASQSTPPWSANPASSDAITARLRCGLIWS